MRPGIDINAVAQAEARARDWTRVHVTGDRNPPLAEPPGPRVRGLIRAARTFVSQLLRDWA